MKPTRNKKAAIGPKKEHWLQKNTEAKRSILKGIKQAKLGKLKTNAVDLTEDKDRL